MFLLSFPGWAICLAVRLQKQRSTPIARKTGGVKTPAKKIAADLAARELLGRPARAQNCR